MERRAVQSGLEIQVAMLRLLSERPDWNLQIGIGIASGEVVLGAMGARDRMDFTVLGSTVNLSARLCSKAPAGDVLVNTSVRDKAVADGTLAVFEVLDPIPLKGYAEPVAAFSVKSAQDSSSAAV
jgi:adenylate cyclase